MQYLLAVIGVFTSMLLVSEGCSCLPAHPQDQYCRADFVIRAKVKKGYMQNDTQTFNYKIKISKEYKMSEKARTALKDGKLFSPPFDGVCGVSLTQGQVYVIAGNVFQLQAHINMCSYHEPWSRISKRQRRGFQRMYRHGCDVCKIKLCNKNKCHHASKNTCYWTTLNWSNPLLDCDKAQGICLPTKKNRSCSWVKNKPQISCLKTHPDSNLYAAYLKNQKAKPRREMRKLPLNGPS